MFKRVVHSRFGDFVATVGADLWATFLGWPVWKRLAAITALLTVVAALLFWDFPSAVQIRGWADALGWAFPALFTLAYATIVLFPIPRTVLTLLSGFLFGPAVGIAVAMTATTLSAVVALVLVRRLSGGWFTPHLNHPAICGLNERLERRGWLAVGSLRMIAAVPFSVLNYAAALTSIRVVPFAIATAIGSLPGTAATVLLGDALTGDVRPENLIVTVVLFAFGGLGLYIDSKLP